MRIHAIETGRVRVKASQLVGHGHDLARRLAPIFDGKWSGWLPTYAFAVEHRDGVALIDTGANAGLNRLPRWHPYFQLAVKFDVEPEQEAGPQLRALGIGRNDVKLIVLTHLHIDHDGGLAAFPHARVLVSPGERAAASGLMGRLNGYLPQRWPLHFDLEPLVLADEPFGPFAPPDQVVEGRQQGRAFELAANACIFVQIGLLLPASYLNGDKGSFFDQLLDRQLRVRCGDAIVIAQVVCRGDTQRPRRAREERPSGVYAIWRR